MTLGAGSRTPGLHRRSFLVLLAAVPVVIAACGSDDASLPAIEDDLDPSTTVISTTTTATNNTEPATSTTVASADSVPPDEKAASADEVLLSLTNAGGFTTREFAFQSPPSLIVTADGRAISPAATPTIFPGPLLPQHVVQTISPAGLDALVAALDDAGVLGDLDLALGDELAIADASTTTLVINTADGEIRHDAYALGLTGGPGEGESTPDRQTLLTTVQLLRGDLETVVGEELGDPEAWIPDAVQIEVLPLAGVDLGVDVTIVDWPASASVPLATSGVDTSGCREIDDPEVVQLLIDADQTTFFRQPGFPSPDDVFQVIARPAYPGRPCEP